VGLIIIFLFLRIVLPREIDDISPGISCEEKYLEKADVFVVIPKFEGIPISENKSWCEEISRLNKTLVLHGINHNYNEFNQEINQSDLEEAIKIFEDCFKETPKFFKAPQLALSSENKILLKKYNLTIKGRLNQFTHKVYHCEDKEGISKGLFKNWIINLF
jgi:predicted deacetylase